MLKESLKSLLSQTKIESLLMLDENQLDQLVQLVEQLEKWNKAYNLTSVRDPKQMVSQHIVDSLIISPFLTGDRFIDVGTGPVYRDYLSLLPILINLLYRSIVLANVFVLFVRYVISWALKTCRQFKAALRTIRAK